MPSSLATISRIPIERFRGFAAAAAYFTSFVHAASSFDWNEVSYFSEVTREGS